MSVAITPVFNGRYSHLLPPVSWTVKSLGVIIGSIHFKGGVYRVSRIVTDGWSYKLIRLGAFTTLESAVKVIQE